MKSTQIFKVVGAIVVAGYCSASFAGPVNSRPVAVSGSTLQDAIDAVTVSGPGIDVATDQNTAAWFTNTSSGGSISTLIVSTLSTPAVNSFGIYDVNNPSNRATVFDSSVATGDQALVSFQANGDIQVNGNVVASGFGDPKTFGMFLDVFDAGVAGFGDGNDATLDYTVYSDDALNNLVNPSGDARVLVFQGDDQTVLQLPPLGPGTFQNNEFILAFENGAPDSAVKDFADFVVAIESVAVVPEPTTGLLLVLGLGAFLRNRRYHT